MSYQYGEMAFMNKAQTVPMSVVGDLSFFSPFDGHPKKKKEATMPSQNLNVHVDTTAQAQDKSLRYLEERLSFLSYEKTREVDRQYSDIRPKSIKETKEWLKSGNYRFDTPKSFDESEDFENFFTNWKSYFMWGKEKPDLKAREEKHAKIEQAYQKALDLVNVVKDEDKRLQALQEFESFTVN